VILASDLVWSPGLAHWVPITTVIAETNPASKPPGHSVREYRRKLLRRLDPLQRAIGGIARFADGIWRSVPTIRPGPFLAAVALALSLKSRTARDDVMRALAAFSALSPPRSWWAAALERLRRNPALPQHTGSGSDAAADRAERQPHWWTLTRRLANAATNAGEHRREIEIDEAPAVAIRKLNLAGLLLAVLLMGVASVWAATAELAGVVIAPGTLVVESNVKKVQHPTGGVVGEILVKEGDEVAAGDVVLRLDATMTKSALGVLQSQLDEATARQARLLAERDDEEALRPPPRSSDRREDSSVGTAWEGEEKLFAARKAAREGQRAQLRERVAQINEEIRGLSAQQIAKEAELDLTGKELTGVTDLYRRRLVPVARFTQLQRDQSRLEGERGLLVGQVARARGRISETELQIIQLEQDFRTQVLKDLRETEGKIAELRERIVAAEDQLKRIELRAPQAGIVHELQVHTVGGVIGNGETILQIVPRADELVVEAKVLPQDIDQLAIGAEVFVRIMAGNQRTTPDVVGVLTRVSPDISSDRQENAPFPAKTYYLVRITLSAQQVARLNGIRLVPGMPAETFIKTQERTALQYLLKPLQEQFARTFRER
jgi:HlyD family secretion protein